MIISKLIKVTETSIPPPVIKNFPVEFFVQLISVSSSPCTTNSYCCRVLGRLKPSGKFKFEFVMVMSVVDCHHNLSEILHKACIFDLRHPVIHIWIRNELFQYLSWL